jgi:hypothetical protein
LSIAEQRVFAPVIARIKPNKIILSALIAALLVAVSTAIVFCCYRASLPLEIDPNEAWNAWQSKSLAHLYPAADALTVNNYPPLYFYLLHAFSSLGAEEIYAGRVISILASLALTFLVYRAIIVLGAERLAAGLGAIWFLATLAGAYTGYLGMNDPHLLGLAVMCAGFTWFVARANKGQPAEPAILLMVFAGFIKHSLIAIPAVALIWLAFDRPREAARTAAFGAAACAAGLLVCRVIYGSSFFEQLMLPRAVGWKNVHLALTYAAPLLGAAAICIAWLVYDRRSRIAQKIGVLLLLTFFSGFVQSLGDGLDVNAYFEFLFALAIGIGMAFSKVQGWPASVPQAAGLRLAFAVVLLVPLAFSSQSEPYKFAFSREFRRDVAENVDAVRTETKRLKKMTGSVSCSVMLVCYWAGKPFVWDDFAMRERVATGRWTEAELKRQARLHHIRFETIDEGTVW